MNKLLEGAVALVTGGSSGSGRAMAHHFAEESAAAVIVADVREHPARRHAHRRADSGCWHGEHVRPVRCGLAREPGSCGRRRRHLRRRNHGHGEQRRDLPDRGLPHRDRGDVHDIDGHQCQGHILRCTGRSEVNDRRRSSRKHNQRLVARRVAGSGPFPTYTASKARFGCSPCRWPTPLADPDGCPPTDTARINQLIPLGRAGTPEDVAGAAVFLASDLAAYLNGHSPGVDAGALRI